jgi:hypothetical protein
MRTEFEGLGSLSAKFCWYRPPLFAKIHPGRCCVLTFYSERIEPCTAILTFEKALTTVNAAAQTHFGWSALNESDRQKGITEAARNLFSALETLINLYNHRQNWSPDNQPREVIPPAVMAIIGNFCGYLAASQIPKPMSDAVKSGSKGRGPEECRDLMIAVTYVAAAREGKISDPAAIKTIMETFAVKRRTVEKWRKELPMLDIDPANLPEYLRQAGNRYRRAGRSQSAIARRSSKRTLKK